MANGFVWWPVLLPVAAGALAAFKNWQPWELVALVAATAPAGALAAWALAWYALRARALDEAPQTDDQIARALGTVLGKAHPWVDAATVAEVWAAHAALPADRRRELALAVLGLVRGSLEENQFQMRSSVLATVRGFVPSAGAPPLDAPDAVARAFGTVVGECSAHIREDTMSALWSAFAALPRERQSALVAALSGFTSAAEVEYVDNLDDKLLAAVAAFRAPTPEPAGTA